MTRLSVVDHGHSLARKAILFVARFMMGAKVPDVVKTLFYRPKFFGDAQAAWTNQVLRGPSTWSVGERELFAAFASRLNECEF